MSPSYGKTYRLLSWISVLLGALYYVVILYLNEVPQDEGDGLQHFSIAQESWNNPALFVEHWGKPLFTLFSSAFAQLGFNGYICFNILVFILSCRVALKIIEHYSTPGFLGVIIPAVLITIPDYSNSIIGGMTEPFFGLLLLLLFLFAIKERWLLFALLASFVPFARSEGMLVVLAAIPYLLLLRQWKYIPLLGVGFIIYCVAGWILLNQPLWYFENNPYAPISIYGSGPWYAYIKSVFDHLGLIPILGVPIALFGLFVWNRQRKKSDILHVLFFGGIYFGIIVIHSYLWAYGLRGALGLSRLATLGLLPFLVLELIAIGYVLRELHKLTHAFFILLIGALTWKELNESTLPTKGTPYQLVLKEASFYLGKHESEVGKIYYFHPLIAHYQGLNTKHLDDKYRQRFIHLKDDVAKVFHPGDLIVRDSKFGSVEQGLGFEELAKYPWIVPVKHFYTTDFFPELNGEQKSVIIYEVLDPKTFDQKKWESGEKRITKEIQGKIYKTSGKIKTEYYNLDTTFTLPKLLGPKQEIIIATNLSAGKNETVYLIFDDGQGYYLSLPITNETKEVVLPFVAGNIKGLLFIHNPSMKPYQLSLTPKYWQQTLDRGIQPIK